MKGYKAAMLAVLVFVFTGIACNSAYSQSGNTGQGEKTPWQIQNAHPKRFTSVEDSARAESEAKKAWIESHPEGYRKINEAGKTEPVARPGAEPKPAGKSEISEEKQGGEGRASSGQ